MEKQVLTEAKLFHSGMPAQVGIVVPTTLGSMNYHVLRTVLEECQVLRLNRGAEIGVLAGITSEFILKSFPALRLYCVDPYVSYNESNRTESAMNSFEVEARNRLAPFGERAEFIKDFSVSAAEQFEDGSLDYVFIDALHTYDAVSADLKAWFPKVRPNGLISGHDISWDGIREAIQDFTRPRGLPAFYTPSTSDVWFFIKP